MKITPVAWSLQRKYMYLCILQPICAQKHKSWTFFEFVQKWQWYQNTFQKKKRSNFFLRLFLKFFDICTHIQSPFVILLLNSWWNRLWSSLLAAVLVVATPCTPPPHSLAQSFDLLFLLYNCFHLRQMKLSSMTSESNHSIDITGWYKIPQTVDTQIRRTYYLLSPKINDHNG